jgi:hypothetical protein
MFHYIIYEHVTHLEEASSSYGIILEEQVETDGFGEQYTMDFLIF